MRTIIWASIFLAVMINTKVVAADNQPHFDSVSSDDAFK